MGFDYQQLIDPRPSLLTNGFAVARIVHYLRHHLVGRTIKAADAIEDASVFGKVGTTGTQVAAALTGKKVGFAFPGQHRFVSP